MFKIINETLMEFFYSEFWDQNISRILTTFGMSMAGTGAKVISSIEPSVNNDQSAMTILEIFQLASYSVSILVGITVVIRFCIFLLDKNKLNKLRKKSQKR